MLLTPLLTGVLETSLNSLLFRDRSMKAARQRLAGKVLRIELQELSSPLVLLFSEQRVDVLGQSEDSADCTVQTRVPVLLKLRDRQQLSPLMRSGELIVEGDIQVVQQLVGLLDAFADEGARRSGHRRSGSHRHLPGRQGHPGRRL